MELIRSCLAPGEVRSLRFLGEGDFCAAYLLNGDRVVRVPRHDEAARALHREACLLAKLGPRLSLPVPRPHLVPCRREQGRSIAIHEAIRGKPLTREVWSSTPAGCRLPRGLRHLLEATFKEALSDPGWWGYPEAILHGDMSPGHVLVDTGSVRIEGIIDWGDAMVGDPARDFIFLYEDWGPDFLDLALEGYGPAPEERQGFLSRILHRYLADQLEWTLGAGAEGRSADFLHGVEALSLALGEFQSDPG